MSVESEQPDEFTQPFVKCGPGFGGVDVVGLPHAADHIEGIIDVLNEKVGQNEITRERADADISLIEEVVPDDFDPYGRSAELVAIKNILDREARLGLIDHDLPQGGKLVYIAEKSADGAPNDIALQHVDPEQRSQEIRRAARAELIYGGEATRPIPVEDPDDLNLLIATDNVKAAELDGLITEEESQIWMSALHEVALVKVRPTHDLEIRYDVETNIPYQVIVKRSRPQND
jgi:hypothetical protein